jgi:hypothetical protein
MALAIVLAEAASAFAQTPSQTPAASTSAQASSRSYRGLFGGSSSGTERDPLAVSLTVAEAYDQDLLGSLYSNPSVYQIGGRFTEFMANIQYRADGRKVRFSTTVGTDLRYYDQQDVFVGAGQYAGAGLSISLTRDTTVTVNQTVSYAPSYLYRLFATPGVPELGQVNSGTNYAVNQSPSLSYGTNVSTTTRVGPRSEFSVQAGGQFTDYVRNGNLQTAPVVAGVVASDLSSYQIGGRFSQALSHDLKLNVGYTFTRAQYYDGATPNEQGLNFGFSYDRPISKTRRTHLSFGVGSSKLERPGLGEDVALLTPYYNVTGDVTFMRQFGRTWQADGAYHRGVGFVDGIRTPVLTDAVVIGASGMINRRVDLAVNAASTVGEPTFSGGLPGFRTNTGTARTHMAFNSRTAMFVEYIFYFYDFPIGLAPIGAPPRVSRNSVRTGLTFWLPVRTR